MSKEKTDRREFQDANDKNKDPEWKNANRDKQQKEDAEREKEIMKDKKNK